MKFMASNEVQQSCFVILKLTIAALLVSVVPACSISNADHSHLPQLSFFPETVQGRKLEPTGRSQFDGV